MSLKLSPVMADVLSRIRANGGTIKRFPGGYWTFDSCHLGSGAGHPFTWSTSAHTVQALVRRGLLAESARQVTRHGGSFPVAYSIVDST